jgi:hypothetical protein
MDAAAKQWGRGQAHRQMLQAQPLSLVVAEGKAIQNDVEGDQTLEAPYFQTGVPPTAQCRGKPRHKVPSARLGLHQTEQQPRKEHKDRHAEPDPLAEAQDSRFPARSFGPLGGT